jgi:uncharacterized membrane protein
VNSASTWPIDAKGFRLRGLASTRLENFVDASFAFALTMLVISVNDIPHSMDALLLALRGIPAYAASFALLLKIWWTHHQFSQRYGLENAAAVRLSLLLVFLVLIFVYPLKIIFGALFAFITDGWLPSTVDFETLNDVRNMFLVYAAAWGSISACLALLYRQAMINASAMELNAVERLQTKAEYWAWIVAVIFGLISALLANFLPERMPYVWMYALPGLIYFGLHIMQIGTRVFVNRRLRVMQSTT